MALLFVSCNKPIQHNNTEINQRNILKIYLNKHKLHEQLIIPYWGDQKKYIAIEFGEYYWSLKKMRVKSFFKTFTGSKGVIRCKIGDLKDLVNKSSHLSELGVPKSSINKIYKNIRNLASFDKFYLIGKDELIYGSSKKYSILNTCHSFTSDILDNSIPIIYKKKIKFTQI